MLALMKIMAIFIALFLLTVTGITINKADPNTMKDLTQPTDLLPSILRQSDEKKEEQLSIFNLAAEEFSLRPSEPCLCSANDVKQALAPFNGPDPPFLAAYRGGKAQIINLADQISDVGACRLADGNLMCEKP